MIVFFHGNAENISTHFASLHWVLNEGYDYFVFDYEGYGRSQGKPSPRATISDGRAAIHWAFQKNPRLPLIILGQSLGGAVALQTVISLKNDTPKDDVPIALVTVDSTFLSYRKVARSVLAQHALTWIFQPLTTLVLSDRYAPGDRVCNISPIPLLVFHGDHDQTVPYSLGKEVYQKAKEPKEFITIPEGHHIDLFWREGGRYRREWIRRLKEILDRKALF